MTKITIDVYSDTLCPFCYIGKKSLDAAISAYTGSHPGAEFDLVWHPFLIHPKFRGRVANKKDYFAAKYGSQVDAFYSRLESRGEPLGIEFRWEGASGSSWDSHKLILKAMDLDRRDGLGGRKRQMGLLDALFRGVFEEGRDVADQGFLATVAVESGVVKDEEEARAVMGSEEMGRRVVMESERGRGSKIEAVPSYLVQGRYFVGGMQEPGVFEEVFGRVGGGEQERVRVVKDGEACKRVGE